MSQPGPILSTVSSGPVSPRWTQHAPVDASTPSSSNQPTQAYESFSSRHVVRVSSDQISNVSIDHHPSGDRSPVSQQTSSSYRSPTKWTNFDDSEDAESETTSHSPKLLDGPGTEGASSDLETKNLLEADGCSEDARSIDEEIYAMSKDQKQYYHQCFTHLLLQTQGSSDTSGALRGADAKVIDFFQKSNLPRDQLSQIWNLSDANQDGWLNIDEFCTAMHLIVLHVKGAVPVPDYLPEQLLPPLTPPRAAETPDTPHSAKLTQQWLYFNENRDNNSPQLKEFSAQPPDLRVEKPVAVKVSHSADSTDGLEQSPALKKRERLSADTNTPAASRLPLSPSAPKGPPPKPPPRPQTRGHTRSASLDLSSSGHKNVLSTAPQTPPPLPPTEHFELREAQTQTDTQMEEADVGVDRKRHSNTKLMDFGAEEQPSSEIKKSEEQAPCDWVGRCERLKKMNAELEQEKARLAQIRLQLELKLQQLK